MIEEARLQHPEENEQQLAYRVAYRKKNLVKRKPKGDFNKYLQVILWLLVFALLAAIYIKL